MGALLLAMLIGFVVTALAIAGIVALAKRVKDQDGGVKVLAVLGIVGLSLLALGGVFSVGCAAIMMSSR
jgi:hypothetical protein